MDKLMLITGVALAIVLSSNIAIAYQMFAQPLDVSDHYTMEHINVVVADKN